MPVASLFNLDGECFQKPNPGGIRTVLVAIAKDIIGVWPRERDIVDGEISVLPIMSIGKKFAVYECPDSTVDIMSQSSGDPGYASYRHAINFSLAGFSKELVAELAKHRNAGSVFVVEQNDGQYSVVASSDNPIFLKSDFKTGKKGADKRGYELKGEQDGFTFDICPLKPTLATALLVIVGNEKPITQVI